MKLLLVLVACASCTYDVSFNDCVVRCATDAECPERLACGDEGLCRAPGVTEACTTVLEAFPSCVGLPTTCGPGGDEDCCTTANVPGGTFLRSYDEASDGMFADQSFPATVSPFVLDRFEVSVGRFRRFVEEGTGTQVNPPAAGTGEHARIPGSGWDPSWNTILVTDAAALSAAIQCDVQYQTWTTALGANENLPINCVTWYEAAAFCAWDGGFLPSESEWNFAAAGGNEQRAYPWSNPVGSTGIDCTFANYNPNYPSGPFCTISGGARRVGTTSPKGDGRWGQADLGGNINEWVLDGYAAYSGTCEDCANLTVTGSRVLRGGDWINAAPTLRGAHRSFTTPTGNRDQKIGFRCARSSP